MEKFNYQKICSELLSDLSEREKEVISRRFGLENKERETLEAIGQDFGVCRERIRQIQNGAMEKIKPKLENYPDLFQFFSNYFKKFGGLRKEDTLLAELGGEKEKNEVYFLFTLKAFFKRFPESEDFYPFWVIDLDSFQLAKKVIDSVFLQLKKIGRPLPLSELNPPLPLKKEVLEAWLEISKIIQKNKENLYGLRDWPEINPRGIKDKAYLVLKKVGKPLHFREITNLIEKANLQTVHNELIKDPRFVLVGRGIYALSEWGYQPGQVKEVILRILKEEKRPLTKEEIVKRVLKQRFVKENTILMNLSDKKYFLRDKEGKYRLRTEII